MGGAERVVRFVESMVGGRAVVKVNSSDENMVIVEEDVEKAYQTIKDEFGINPVRIITGSIKKMKFTNMEFDKVSQHAEISYLYKEKNVSYFISAAYKDSSLGMDVDEKIENEYQIKNKECIINVREYKSTDGKDKRYSANFRYKGLEYFLIGTMRKEEFEIILEKLYFMA